MKKLILLVIYFCYFNVGTFSQSDIQYITCQGNIRYHLSNQVYDIIVIPANVVEMAIEKGSVSYKSLDRISVIKFDNNNNCPMYDDKCSDIKIGNKCPIKFEKYITKWNLKVKEKKVDGTNYLFDFKLIIYDKELKKSMSFCIEHVIYDRTTHSLKIIE